MNISRKTEDRIRSVYASCETLTDTYSPDDDQDTNRLRECLKLAKQDRPTMEARALVCMHYLQGLRVGLGDRDPWSLRNLAYAQHGLQRAYLLGVTDGYKALTRRPHQHLVGLALELQDRLEDSWDEHRQRNLGGVA